MSESAHLFEIDAAIEARAAKTEEGFDLSTPHGRMRRHWKAVTRRVHPSRVGEVVALLSNAEDKIDRLVADGDIGGALREVDRVTSRLQYGGFTGAKPEPLQQDVWRPELIRFGWGPDMGLLFNDEPTQQPVPNSEPVAPGTPGMAKALDRAKEIERRNQPHPWRGGLVAPWMKITWVDWWTVEVDGVAHSHEGIRARAGVRGQPIPTRPEVEKQAETDPAIREILRRIDAHKK
jgi:hypothetical protein